jgi:IS30 family transposase
MNENTNGRIRKYIPRSFDITKLDQKAVDFIAKKMNSVPRKFLAIKPQEK